jgi:hypothetical protein
MGANHMIDENEISLVRSLSRQHISTRPGGAEEIDPAFP